MVHAGGIRFQEGVFERHMIEELDSVESEYICIELGSSRWTCRRRSLAAPPTMAPPYEWDWHALHPGG